MRFFFRSLAGLFLLAATAGLLAASVYVMYSALQTRWSKETHARPARERVFVVDTVRYAPGRITPTLTAFGEVRARRQLEIRATAGGEVIALGEGFEEGGKVSAGQLLLRVDPTDFIDARDLAAADLAEARAEVRNAEAALALARDDLDSALHVAELRAQALARQEDLVARGVGTDAAVETAALAAASAEQAVLSRRQALANAEARVDQAKSMEARREIALEEAERRLAETEIHAGFAGTLSHVSALEGGLVTQNERIATLIDPTALEVSFRVSTAQYARLIGDDGALIPAPVEARLDVAGVDLVAHGRIARESAEVGEGQTGRLIFARLDHAVGFRPGDFVTVSVEEPPLENVARLPAAALDASGEVLVIGEGDRLEAAKVTLLRRQGDDVLVRADGLDGREIVAGRSPVLGVGIRVRRAGDAAAAPGVPEGASAKPTDETADANGMIVLDEARRTRLIAFVEGNDRMPQAAKERLLSALRQERVPADMVARLERRMGS